MGTQLYSLFWTIVWIGLAPSFVFWMTRKVYEYTFPGEWDQLVQGKHAALILFLSIFFSLGGIFTTLILVLPREFTFNN